MIGEEGMEDDQTFQKPLNPKKQINQRSPRYGNPLPYYKNVHTFFFIESLPKYLDNLAINIVCNDYVIKRNPGWCAGLVLDGMQDHSNKNHLSTI